MQPPAPLPELMMAMICPNFSQQPGDLGADPYLSTPRTLHYPTKSKTKKRKNSKNEEEDERKRIRVGSRKRWSSQTDATNQPKRQKNLPDDGHDLELSQPETSAQSQPLPPEPPLPSKQKSGKALTKYSPKSSVVSSWRIKRLFTIPNSQLTNEQKRRRLQFVFNRNPAKYGVHDDTILNNAGNPITDSSVAQALDYIIERRAGRIPQFRQPPGTKLIRDRINRDLILRTWTAPPVPPRAPKRINARRRPSAGIKQKITEIQRDEAGERQGARRIDTSISNEGGQAEVDGSISNRNGNSIQKPTSQTKEMDKSIEKHYLEGNRTYTLMRPRRINFPRARTTAAGFMTDCQVDLADFQTLSRHNRGNRYLMVVIDVLSKRIFVTPLRTKKADDMLEGFKQVFSTMPMKPHRIFSDKGTEFRNQQLKKLLMKRKSRNMRAHILRKKAALAERAIRQIKNRVYRYFAQTKTLNWVDVIDQIVNWY
ncbi:hypothetical protein niasHT_016800 [Heterodera trifolii]|uniref:Integrase catalytic domain-containing protein n=1 Tax=Heterodera trifolii TaxID=157864 RepID=A0ABD2L102_9BILA